MLSGGVSRVIKHKGTVAGRAGKRGSSPSIPTSSVPPFCPVFFQPLRISNSELHFEIIFI